MTTFGVYYLITQFYLRSQILIGKARTTPYVGLAFRSNAFGSQAESCSGVMRGLSSSVCASQAALIGSGTWYRSSVSFKIWRRRSKWPPSIGCLACTWSSGRPEYGYGSPEEMSCQLIFLIFNAPSVCVAKEKTDHAVIEYSVNKRMNDRSHLRLASKLLKKSLTHRGRFGTSEVLEGLLYSENSYIIPSWSRAARTSCSDPMEVPTRDQASHR